MAALSTRSLLVHVAIVLSVWATDGHGQVIPKPPVPTQDYIDALDPEVRARPSTAEIKKDLLRIMAGSRGAMPSTSGRLGGPFCSQFIADLKTLKGINLVEPIVVTQNYSNWLFRRFRSNCAVPFYYHQNDQFGFPFMHIAGDLFSNNSTFFLTRNHRFYKVDIYNGAHRFTNGKWVSEPGEHWLYIGERYCVKGDSEESPEVKYQASSMTISRR